MELYLYSVGISFITMYIIVYNVLRKEKNEKHIFNSFTFYFLLYLSILPIVNLIFAVLFLLIPITSRDELKEREKEN